MSKKKKDNKSCKKSLVGPKRRVEKNVYKRLNGERYCWRCHKYHNQNEHNHNSMSYKGKNQTKQIVQDKKVLRRTKSEIPIRKIKKVEKTLKAKKKKKKKKILKTVPKKIKKKTKKTSSRTKNKKKSKKKQTKKQSKIEKPKEELDEIQKMLRVIDDDFDVVTKSRLKAMYIVEKAKLWKMKQMIKDFGESEEEKQFLGEMKKKGLDSLIWTDLWGTIEEYKNW